jgi:hypothetical protein
MAVPSLLLFGPLQFVLVLDNSRWVLPFLLLRMIGAIDGDADGVPPHRFVEIAGIVRAQMPLWELWHVVYC